MKTKVFIDGHEGTTGLRIHERLSQRQDIELIPIADEKRKDPDAIRACMKDADIAFLCLPDDAAAEAVKLAEAARCASSIRRRGGGWPRAGPTDFRNCPRNRLPLFLRAISSAIPAATPAAPSLFTTLDGRRFGAGRLSGDSLFP